MQFYKIILKFECENEEKQYHVINKKAMLMGMECQEYTERILDDKGYMFISSVTDRTMLMGVILKSVENTDYVKKIENLYGDRGQAGAKMSCIRLIHGK